MHDIFLNFFFSVQKRDSNVTREVFFLFVFCVFSLLLRKCDFGHDYRFLWARRICRNLSIDYKTKQNIDVHLWSCESN